MCHGAHDQKLVTCLLTLREMAANVKTTGQSLIKFYMATCFAWFYKSSKVNAFDLDLWPWELTLMAVRGIVLFYGCLFDQQRRHSFSQCTGTRSAVEALCVMRYTSRQSSSSSSSYGQSLVVSVVMTRFRVAGFMWRQIAYACTRIDWESTSCRRLTMACSTVEHRTSPEQSTAATASYSASQVLDEHPALSYYRIGRIGHIGRTGLELGWVRGSTVMCNKRLLTYLLKSMMQLMQSPDSIKLLFPSRMSSLSSLL